ncbi:MAG: serine/threonine protein kinase [Verrucomicrobia bacterium]|nr:serine/threonine protein kinase [Verrucomicrobiota bacterium]
MFWWKKKTNGDEPAPSGCFGPYRLHEIISRGGMAEIWLATTEQGQSVALRLGLQETSFGSAAKKMFLNGCKAQARIKPHENVIRYIEHGKIGGRPYLLMEYVEGSNLRQLIQSSDPSLADCVARILIDSAAALMHVHDNDFLHLDFKPENVIVTRNGSVRLVDFDLAQPLSENPEKMPNGSGTPAYMAPEQLLNEPVDRRADIFAFGVTAYELLTFKQPFNGKTQTETLRNKTNRNYRVIPPREHNPDIPLALENTILKCLEREPDNRYPYASVVVRDLREALEIETRAV